MLQTVAATEGDGSTVERVAGAQQRTKELLDVTSQHNALGATLEGRVNAAKAEADAAVAKENQVFDDSTKMADYMINFDKIAAGKKIQNLV